MEKFTVTINTAVGLHARPASEFVKTANQFKSSIKIGNSTRGTALVNGKSILKVLTLGAAKGHLLTLEFEGDDEHEAAAAIRSLFDSNFGE